VRLLDGSSVTVYGTGNCSYVGLHGWGADHRTFEPLEPFLPQSVQLVCPDFPGCGGIPPPDEWTIDCIIEGTAEILTAQSMTDPPTIVGSCLGAVFALEMLYRGIISTERLVIIDPLIFFPMYLRIFLLGKFGEGAYRASMETGVGRIMANLISKVGRSSDVDMTADLKNIDHDSAYRYLKMMADLPNPKRYADLELNVDIIYGEETFRFARKSSKALKEIWKHAREFQVPKASHLPIIEQTEYTARLLFDNVLG
jgi:pimeloyl-ACP methyl ester carboxylesterase